MHTRPAEDFWDPLSLMLSDIKDRLPRFKATFESTLDLFGKRADFERISTSGANQSGLATVWGVATLKWLIDNRHSRTELNDYLFAAMCAREAGWVKLQDYPKSYNGNSSVTGLRKPVNVSTSPAWVADIAYRDGKLVDGVAIGFGQRQDIWWESQYRGYKGLSTRDSKLSESGYWDVWYGLGCFPWWVQALLTARDVQIMSSRYSYLQALGPVPQDPSFRECYYPYYLLEQPALNKRSISMMTADFAIKKPNELFKAEGLNEDFQKILLSGLPLSLPDKGILFADELNDRQWLRLVTGVSNYDVVETDIANTGAGFPTEQDLHYSLGESLVMSDVTKASDARNFALSGKWTLDTSNDVTDTQSTYHFSRSINLF